MKSRAFLFLAKSSEYLETISSGVIDQAHKCIVKRALILYLTRDFNIVNGLNSGVSVVRIV